MDCLKEIIRLGSANRLAALVYQKPGEDSPTARIVEAYSLQSIGQNVAIVCWQIEPRITDRLAWRHFRADRMIRVSDGGGNFNPRTPVTLGTGEISAFEWGHTPVQTLSDGHKYFNSLEAALADKVVNQREVDHLRTLAKAITPDQLRGAHAQTYANALQELLADGEITEKEDRYLKSVRKVLAFLGYEP